MRSHQLRMPQALRSSSLGRNGVFALGQSLILLVCMFLSFRILVGNEGMEGLGLWSLLMIFGGVAATVDVSGAAALSRTVARQMIEFADTQQAVVVHTVLLTSIAINMLLSLTLLALANLLLPQLVTPEQLPQARQLLPFVAVLMMSMPLAIGVGSAMDGLLRADLRAILLSAAAVCGLIVAAIAIPRFGIRGFAIAQLVQQGLVIAGGWIWLRRQIPGLGWLPTRWSKSVFRRTTGYAMKLNAIGVMGLLLEPLTKYCINLAGGLTAVASYELAARLITQLRGLTVSAAIPAIPVFAAGSPGDEGFMSILVRTNRHIAFAAFAVALLSVAAAPVMCWLILGEGHVDVLQMNALLAFGWSINLIALPIYIAAQGQGVLRWNMLSHALNGIGVIAGVMLFGDVMGQAGVVAGVAAGLVVGTIATIWGNSRMFAAQSAIRRSAALTVPVVLAIGAICTMAWFAAEPVVTVIGQIVHG